MENNCKICGELFSQTDVIILQEHEDGSRREIHNACETHTNSALEGWETIETY